VLDERADSRRRDNQLYKVMIFFSIVKALYSGERCPVRCVFSIRHDSVTGTANASSSDIRCFTSVLQRVHTDF
jgi:hypothetical protein